MLYFGMTFWEIILLSLPVSHSAECWKNEGHLILSYSFEIWGRLIGLRQYTVYTPCFPPELRSALHTSSVMS